MWPVYPPYTATSQFGHLRGRRAAQLLHALDDVRDAEHVRVRQQAAVRVERQLPGVVVQRVAFHERTDLTFRAEAHVLDLHEAHHGERVVHGEHVDVGGREAGHRERARRARTPGACS